MKPKMAKKSTVKKVARTGVAKAKTPIKKTIEQRYFEFLKELQEYSKVGGFKSFAPLIKKHGISKNVSAVLLSYVPKCIIKLGSGEMHPLPTDVKFIKGNFLWLARNPTMDMAIALVKDVKKYTDKSKAKKASTLVNQMPVDVFTENISVAEKIINDVNTNKTEIVEQEKVEIKHNPNADKIDVVIFTENLTVSNQIIKDVNNNKAEIVEISKVEPELTDIEKKFNDEIERMNFIHQEEKIAELEREIKTLEYSKENIGLTYRKLLFDMDSPDFLVNRLCSLDNHEEAIKNSPFYTKEIKKLNDKIEENKEYIYELKTEVKSLKDDKNESEAIIEVIRAKWRFRFIQFLTGKGYFKRITKKAYLKLALRKKFIMPIEGTTTLVERIEIARNN